MAVFAHEIHRRRAMHPLQIGRIGQRRFAAVEELVDATQDELVFDGLQTGR